ncbi:MAG: hypothetical protein IKB98_02990 [Clostridia bacterium]|nr:hypothetical protein [Clostridia bacterium]
MIITFCGHSSFDNNENQYKLYDILCENIKDNPVDFYVGGYGSFDHYALCSALEYKEKHNDTKIYFVTPYLDKRYSKLEYYKNVTDGIIFPELENVPKKFAIIKRNEWMVKQADLVIAYVRHSWGGARRTFEFAKRLQKKIINLAD